MVFYHISILLGEGENPQPHSHFSFLEVWGSLFPALSTVVLKLLGCPGAQAASKSCLKMARDAERYLITAPKIHGPIDQK